MITGWRYRLLGATGVGILSAIALLIANHPIAQQLFTSYVPLFWRLDPVILTGEGLRLALFLSTVAMLAALFPLYKPRPRRILDTIVLTQKRVLLGGLALATIGFFQWSHRLPRATLVMVVGILSVALPVWFILICQQMNNTSERAVIIGDDAEQISTILNATDMPVLGYLCPSNTYWASTATHMADDVPEATIVTDGGRQWKTLDRLGGLSKVDDVLLEYNIDTAILAFHTADREEFFGTLGTCHKHGVNAKVHRKYADDVLTSTEQVGTLVDVDIEPWDPQDYVFKRVFDILFAWAGLIVLSPLMLVIGIAIKLDSPGPVFYEQKRTAGFGETFTVYKFRTMIPENESVEPLEDGENDRITRVGRVLRRTHLDEIPQLWAIFVGEMSVVGPRAAWVEEEESVLETEANAWRKRWFVKPGLTGLAQINDVKSTDPEKKLRYDLRYIREQTFWFDLKIVVRQIWKVVADVSVVVRENGPANDQTERRGTPREHEND